jgi:hypothetical protein
MTPQGPGASRAVLVEPAPTGGVIRFLDKTLVMAELEIRKLRHDSSELVTRAIQPALWLLVFGQVFTQIRAIPTKAFSLSPSSTASRSSGSAIWASSTNFLPAPHRARLSCWAKRSRPECAVFLRRS